MIGPLTWGTFVALMTFAGVDLAAHTTHYRYGETFSAWVKKSPWLRALAGFVLLVLFPHLVLNWY